jgi:hypothetical protein
MNATSGSNPEACRSIASPACMYAELADKVLELARQARSGEVRVRLLLLAESYREVASRRIATAA